MRPLNETPADRDRERAALLESIDLLCDFENIPIIVGRITREKDRLAAWDAVLHGRGGPSALVEVKCRTTASDAYPTLRIAKHKIDRLSEAAGWRGLRGILMVRWTDATGLILARDAARCPVVEIGRRDRGQAADIEPGYNIPVAAFWPQPLLIRPQASTHP